MPILQLLNGPRAGSQWLVINDRFTIGRDPRCDAEVNDIGEDFSRNHASVSRKHALLVCTDGHWYIEDGDGNGKKSRNGLSINDKKLAYPGRRELHDQDRIRICGLRFVFLTDFESQFSLEAALGHADSSTCLDTQPPDRLRQLLEISAALLSTLDADAVLERMVEHLFRMFPHTQRCLVFLTRGDSGPLELRTVRTPHGEQTDVRYSSSVVRRCFESMEAVLGNDLPQQFPESESIGYLSTRSLMCSPLWTPGGSSRGVVQLEARADHRKFTTDDLRLFLGVASQSSIALSNARLHQEALLFQQRTRDMEVAHHVQLALLPRERPRLPNFDFFTYYESAQEVGGDYYDFIPLADGRLAVLLGDVTGHGVAAALIVAKFSVEARVCLETSADPAQALNRLNAQWIRTNLPEKYVTVAVALLDPKTHTAVVANAGHPAPMFVKASGEVLTVAGEEISGFPIGVNEGTVYQSQEVRLEPGDRLLIFSDGVSEALDASDRLFGLDGIRQAVAVGGIGPQATGEQLLQAVNRHTTRCDQNDDITVVCFGRLA